MATKRLYCETEPCPDQPSEKRSKPRPTFASIIGEVVMVNASRNLCKAIEPVLRRVVTEEVENCLRRYSRSFTRSSSLRIQALEPTSYQLVFLNKLSLPIFTGSKITDIAGNPLQLLVVGSDGVPATAIPPAMKVELVVLDGDFPPGDRENWTAEEFDGSILKERAGRRPLLHGEINTAVRLGGGVVGEIEFTDNSSWVRCRKFRVGARLVSGSDSGRRIREAVTEAFVVRDHRGELYKKHYPPKLHDEVWRLEKIGKEGVFHKKLSQESINSVQDFLQLSMVDEKRLRKILGAGMSDRMWESTIKHAKTCVLGNKLYLFRGHDVMLLLNPICEVVRAILGDQVLSSRDLVNISKGYMKDLMKQAYDNWHSLQEMEGNSSETLLLTQGFGSEEIGMGEEREYMVGRSGMQESYHFMEGQMDFHYN